MIIAVKKAEEENHAKLEGEGILMGGDKIRGINNILHYRMISQLDISTGDYVYKDGEVIGTTSRRKSGRTLRGSLDYN